MALEAPDATGAADAISEAAEERHVDERFRRRAAVAIGKVELLAKAQAYEQRRDRAARQDPNFDYAQALYQIAIVLGSVSIVATSRRLLILAVALGAVATLLMLNGLLLLVELPIG
jgi:hypothetical protein